MTKMVTAGIVVSSIALSCGSKWIGDAFVLLLVDGHGGCWTDCGKERRNYMTATTTRNAAVKTQEDESTHFAYGFCYESPTLLRDEFYKKVLKSARDKFTREIYFQSKDKDISLAKAPN